VRRASSLPRHRSRWQSSGRLAIIAIGVFIIVVVVFGRALARFYVDLLWHRGLGESSVFWTTITAKLTLFGGFFLLAVLMIAANLAIADRLAPTSFPANVHPYVERFHDVFGRRLRLYRYVVAVLLALALAGPTIAQWQSWLLFRHRQSFGATDGQFGVDVGFYVFELPFISFVLDWLFIALFLVLIVTAITHLLNGGVVFASPIPTVSHGTRGHLAVLLALLAALKAADYWVQRYETTNERRGFVQGATYAVVHAQLPALLLLMVVAIITAGLYLSTLRTQSFRLAFVASAVWLVLALLGDYVYPAIVQSLVVKPNQASREQPFIERNVEATRAAMGITNVTPVDITFDQLVGRDIQDDPQPLRDVRLLNPNEMLSRFQIDEGVDAGLIIDDLDVDRYDLGGPDGVEQVLVGARELDVNQSANRSWQGQHLINTRGCGVVMAPAGRVQSQGRPIYRDADLDRPELYFSPTLEGYAVAGTDVQPSDCGDNAPYTGTAGVEMSSFVRRLAFGLAFMDYNLIGSGAIHHDSEMLWVRNVRDRVEKLAPFLSYDGDPYPVVLDGRVLWVIDAYTSTSRYPYAEAVGDDIRLSENSGIPRDANYVRNSVKAVVDAYDGTVRMYIVDETDPIVRAWANVFPSLFSSADEMPAGLRDHLRYPEDLFRVQTNVYSKYQLAPEDFFEREGAWSVAQAPPVVARSSAVTAVTTSAASTAASASASDERSPNELATETSNDRFIPYYTMFGGERDFVLLRPFVPFSRDDQRTALQAYMTASSDPETYGQLTVYEVDGADGQPAGPLTVANLAVSTPDISELITLQSQGGAQVRFGDLQLVPIVRTGSAGGHGLLYVRPLYLTVQRSSGTPPTESTYQYVVVSTDDGTAAYASTIGGALSQLFPGLDVDLGERAPGSAAEVMPGVVVDNGSGSAGDEGGAESSISTPEELLTQADRLLREADDDLRVNGNLGAYQEKVDQATELVTQALTLMGAPPPEDTVAVAAPGSVPVDSQPNEAASG
jgi:uncharacterized protein